MLKRIALGLQYDGGPWHGWQTQPHGRTVQDVLESALAKFCQAPIATTCAGRTDAGVHALSQVVHFDTTVSRENFSWVRGVNAFLPDSIAVQWATEVEGGEQGFHARFSAHSKIYRYCLWHDDTLPPLLYQRAWQVHGPLDIGVMRRMANALMGTHDFRGFTARSGAKRENTIRTLYCVKVLKQGKEVRLMFHGNGFLYHMVRMLVGAMVHVARGTLLREDFLQRLVRAQPPIAPRTAPASGLYLTRVLYKK
jgi:tRNA pseudouridine38-40 synthase